MLIVCQLMLPGAPFDADTAPPLVPVLPYKPSIAPIAGLCAPPLVGMASEAKFQQCMR